MVGSIAWLDLLFDAKLFFIVLFVKLADLLAGLEAIHDGHVQVHDDCVEMTGLDLHLDNLVLAIFGVFLGIIVDVKLSHILLYYFDGLITVNCCDQLKILIKIIDLILHYHECEWLVINQ